MLGYLSGMYYNGNTLPSPKNKSLVIGWGANDQ